MACWLVVAMVPDVTPPRIVITPKLRAPSPRPEQLARPRLLESLRNTSGCKIILVSAPAGYGKTTLLAYC